MQPIAKFISVKNGVKLMQRHKGKEKIQKVKLDSFIDRKHLRKKGVMKVSATLAAAAVVIALLINVTVPVSAAAGQVQVTGSTVNIRSDAGTAYAVVGKVHQGETYTCIGEKKDRSGQKWYQIRFSDGRSGWITAKYAKSAAAPVSVKKVEITGATVNVRTGAGAGYQKLGVAQKGDTYLYLDSVKTTGGVVWYKLQFSQTRAGWITSKYSKLITVNPSEAAETTTTTSAKTTASATSITTTAQTTTSTVEKTTTAKTTTSAAQKTTTAKTTTTTTKPQSNKYVKVTSHFATAHITPGHSAPPAGTAEYGKTYPYIESYTTAKKNIWYKVQYTPEKTAWIAKTDSQLSDSTISAAPATAKQTVDKIAKKYGAVGVQVAVIKDGQVTSTCNYGYAVKGSIPMNSDHKIRIASISKVVVVMNAMKMQEDGLVSLDENIGTYWNTSPYKKTTLRQLLSHTSYLRDNAYSGSKSGMASQLRSSASYRSSNSWMYNNYGLGMAGSTLEVAANQTLNSYANENFFAPLDIDASFTSGNLQNTGKLAALYYPSDSLARSVSSAKQFKGKSVGGNTAYFAGGLTISAKDMAKLTAILANDGMYEGTRYLSKQSVSTIETPCADGYSRGHSFKQCLPLRYQTNIYGQKKLYYHLGTAYGTLSFMGYNPDTKNGVVVITTGASNAYDSYGTFKVCAEIAEYFFNH